MPSVTFKYIWNKKFNVCLTDDNYISMWESRLFKKNRYINPCSDCVTLYRDIVEEQY